MNEYFAGRRKRRMAKILIILATVLLLTLGIYYFLKKFTIRNVTVDGSTHYTKEEIADMVIQSPHEHISLVLSMKYHNKPITNIAFIQSIGQISQIYVDCRADNNRPTENNAIFYDVKP